MVAHQARQVEESANDAGVNEDGIGEVYDNRYGAGMLRTRAQDGLTRCQVQVTARVENDPTRLLPGLNGERGVCHGTYHRPPAAAKRTEESVLPLVPWS
jgi:hypothetical protein